MTKIAESMRMTLSTRYLLAQLATLDKLGFSHERSFEMLNMSKSQLSDMPARIPIDDVLPIFQEAEKVLENPLVGLEVGFRFRIGSFTKTGAIYSYCENLIQVIEMNHRYQRLAIDVGRVHYNVVSDPQGKAHHYMQFDTYYEDHNKYRHITDLVMGAFGTAYRWLSWGSAEEMMAVHLPYDAPEHTELYQRVFQCEAQFNCPFSALEFTSPMMHDPLTTHDPEKLAITIAQLDQMLDAATAGVSLKAAIEAAMRRSLQKGSISSAIISERLQQPERKLRAEMKKAGLTYRTLLDGVRQDMFLEQHRTGESFAAIAQNLAYNDQAAFNRAFRRWYGVAPGQWQDEPAQ